MHSRTIPIVVSVPPALIGICLDRLQRLPPAPSHASDHLLLVATCTASNEDEAAALFVRLVTAAFICRDARWRQWRTFSRSSVDAAIAFEALVIHLFATLPLQDVLHRSADDFFAALITGVHAIGRG
ncbi:MAG: hypothetical protein EKK41_24200 [Hyphomicrobiales bacterium]|nr:MAG: hypothetical protein EKK41_24200 [Hyphomicrobiales bacterium]